MREISNYLDEPSVIIRIYKIRGRQESLNQRKRWGNGSRGWSDTIAGFEEGSAFGPKNGRKIKG